MVNLIACLAQHAAREPAAIALTGDGVSLSYGELCREVEATARLIAERCPGTRPVALHLDNGPAWAIFDLALLQLGRTCVPVPSFFTPQQQGHALHQSGAGHVISAAGSHRADVIAGCGVAINPCATPEVSLPDGTAKVTFTSGSTGTPKGVCLSRAMLEETAAAIVTAVGREHGALHCAVLPLAVLLENVAGLYAVLLAGGTYAVPAPRDLGLGNPFAPDFARLAAALAEMQATSIITVPELLRGLMAALSMTRQALPTLRFVAVGGARVSPRLLAQAESLGLPVYEGYGLSEAGSVISLNRPGAARAGTAGQLLAHVRASLAGDGELVIEHPMFLGYTGGAAAPAALRTGDIVARDAEGYLAVTGRKSALIITGFGRNVAPEWIESELLAQPVLGQACVFGEASSGLTALLVPVSAQITARQIEAAVKAANDCLPPYATITRWRVVPPFTPMNGQLTANGRLRRKEIALAHGQSLPMTPETHTEHHMTFFDTLLRETSAERAKLLETRQIQDGLQGRISRETYISYLTEAYHHVKHTVPLMQAAKAKLLPHQAWLAPALDEYVEEEAGHEEWILDDIAAAGGNALQVRNGTPRPATEFMIAYAYDYVNRINPVGLFGMVLVLEGTSIALASKGASAIQASLGLPDGCFHYLTSHGALDQEHMKFFEALMNKIEDRGDQAAIIHMARRMYLLFAGLFQAIPHGGREAHAA